MTSERPASILVCNVNAIPGELRPVHQANTERIFP
jgi:hypothetical protein